MLNIIEYYVKENCKEKNIIIIFISNFPTEKRKKNTYNSNNLAMYYLIVRLFYIILFTLWLTIFDEILTIILI